MNKKVIISFLVSLLFSGQALAWKYMTGKIEILYVNTYGNLSANSLNGGYCFKLEGYDHFLKIPYAESGEQRQNIELVQSIILAAYMSNKQVKATYVDWGEDTSCRYNGARQPAKWLENLQVL